MPRPTCRFAPAVVAEPSDPCVVSDLPPDLPVHVLNADFQFRHILAFLDWVDIEDGGVQAAAISLAELERVFLRYMTLDLLDPALCVAASMPSDEAFARIFKGLRKHLKNLTFSCEADFHKGMASIVRLQGILDLFVLTDDLMFALEPDRVVYPNKARWIGALTWAHASASPRCTEALSGSFGIVALLGNRQRQEERQDRGGRVVTVATQLFDAFVTYSGSALPEPSMPSSILSWFSNKKWPVEFHVKLGSLSTATTELLHCLKFNEGKAEDRSQVIDLIFDRVLEHSATLRDLAAGCTAEDARDEFQLLLEAYDIGSAPSLQHWNQLGNFLVEEARIDQVAAFGDGKLALGRKVARIVSDKKKSLVKDDGKSGGGLSAVATADGSLFAGGADKESLQELLVDPQLARLVAKLAILTPGTDDDQVIAACMQCRLSGVVRWLVGLMPSGLAVDPVFHRHAASKLPTFSEDHLQPIALYLGNQVTSCEHAANPDMELFAFSTKFVKQLLMGQYDQIDFEQRLILDINEFRAGRGDSLDLCFNRPTSSWFKTEHQLRGLIRPMSLLMQALGHRESDMQEGDNSPTAILTVAEATWDFIRQYDCAADDVSRQMDRFIRLAFKQAGESYMRFFTTKSAHFPFPVSWIPPGSKCMRPLEGAKAEAIKLSVMVAKVPQVMEKLLGHSGKRSAGNCLHGML